MKEYIWKKDVHHIVKFHYHMIQVAWGRKKEGWGAVAQ